MSITWGRYDEVRTIGPTRQYRELLHAAKEVEKALQVEAIWHTPVAPHILDQLSVAIRNCEQKEAV